MSASKPSNENDNSSKHSTLRHTAETELRSGNLDLNSGWALPAETLETLYKLASDPDGAADALKLLHELQTHQVELELQYRELEANEQFMGEQLTKFKGLLDASSIGYIVADANGHILEINSAAIDLLAIADQNLRGTSVSQFFQPDAQSRLRALFKQLSNNDDSDDVVSIESAHRNDSDGKQLKITASISLAGHAVLMTIMENSPSQTN